MKRAHANQKIEMIQCGLYYKLRIGVFAYSETNLNNRTPIYRRKQEHLLVHFFLLFLSFDQQEVLILYLIHWIAKLEEEKLQLCVEDVKKQRFLEIRKKKSQH